MTYIAQSNVSEIARIRQQIELECTSMVHASMFAATASHKIIDAKFKTLDTLTDQLAQHMSKEQAISTMIETYDNAIEKARQGTDEQKQML